MQPVECSVYGNLFSMPVTAECGKTVSFGKASCQVWIKENLLL